MEPESSRWCVVKGQEATGQDEIRETPLEHKKIFFTVRVVEPWKKFSRQVVEWPYFKILRSQLDTVLNNLF